MRFCREIEGLKWAHERQKGPFGPSRRPKGLKGVGLAFERRAGEAIERTLGAIAEVRCKQWFEFEDSNGRGWCQTDILVIQKGQVVVFECKLTETLEGRMQISKLYCPVLMAVYNRPVRGVVVARHLTRETDRSLVTGSLEDALAYSEKRIPTLHWLGKGRI